ncbi:MFS monosaccharide transporter [Mycena floridula]|nr:MFS monosaccharide transporter [Mycena floridula]
MDTPVGPPLQQNTTITVMMLIFSAFGGILAGYDTGIIGGIIAMRSWLRDFGFPTDDLVHYPSGFMVSSATLSIVLAILSVGSFFGAVLSAQLAGESIYSLSFCIVVACAVFSVGIAMQTASRAIPLFIVGRLFAGFGVGAISSIVPMFQSECAPKNLRGAVVLFFIFFNSFGLLVASIVNNATAGFDGSQAYTIPIAIQFVFAAIVVAGISLLPESPAFYMKKGEETSAARSLARFTGLSPTSQEVAKELTAIRENMEHHASQVSSYHECFRLNTPNKMALRTWTAIGCQVCQQLSGIFFVGYYQTTLFVVNHLPHPFMLGIYITIVMLVASMAGTFVVERFGRRGTLLTGAIGMGVSHFAIAIMSITVTKSNNLNAKLGIVAIASYWCFFFCCWAGTPFVVATEIFPLRLRAKGISMGAVIVVQGPFLVNAAPGSAGLGSKVFFIWGVGCVICFIFTYFFTQGMSFEEIDLMYEHTSPRKSKEYRARLAREKAQVAATMTVVAASTAIDGNRAMLVNAKV